MDFEQIKQYWENRAKQNPSGQSTTDDVFLRILESQKLIEGCRQIKLTSGIAVDVGCGDGNTTFALAKSFPDVQFFGIDYAENMITIAQQNFKNSGLENLHFAVADIVKKPFSEKANFIFSSRCLINLPSWELQQKAIENIYLSLHEDGHYIMIENFMDGQREFNLLRQKFGLPEIIVRPHNLFFEPENLMPFLEERFKLLECKNISSLYYIVSRIIYSKICQIEATQPDYYDLHHELGAMLPDCGNFGPIKLLLLRRKCK